MNKIKFESLVEMIFTEVKEQLSSHKKEMSMVLRDENVGKTLNTSLNFFLNYKNNGAK